MPTDVNAVPLTHNEAAWVAGSPLWVRAGTQPLFFPGFTAAIAAGKTGPVPDIYSERVYRTLVLKGIVTIVAPGTP
jgi:hypothetical protein